MRWKPIYIIAFVVSLGVGLLFLVSMNNEKDDETSASLPAMDESTTEKVELPIPPSAAARARAPVFEEVDAATKNKLQPWYDDVFIADHKLPKMIVRANFVRIDAENIMQELARSLQSSQTHGHTTEASTELYLFPDRNYEVVVDQFRLGSSGFSHFGTAVVGATGLGREYFQFEISPAGQVTGRGTTATGVYEFKLTPDPDVLLVTEIDEVLIGNSIRIN